LCPSTLFNIEKKLNGGSSKMGIKRRIISSGRKFVTKHASFFKAYLDRKEAEAGGADSFAWVDSMTLTDLESDPGTFTIAAVLNGDLEAADKLKVYINGVAQNQAAMDALTAGIVGGTGGETVTITAVPHTTNEEITVKVSVLRAGTAEIANSEKSGTVTITGN
jgi:hypothetical protein